MPASSQDRKRHQPPRLSKLQPPGQARNRHYEQPDPGHASRTVRCQTARIQALLPPGRSSTSTDAQNRQQRPAPVDGMSQHAAERTESAVQRQPSPMAERPTLRATEHSPAFAAVKGTQQQHLSSHRTKLSNCNSKESSAGLAGLALESLTRLTFLKRMSGQAHFPHARLCTGQRSRV
jgi:hypothetical protein